MKILIVEDHAILSSGIKQLIESTDDLEVCGQCETAEDAFELILKIKPDCITMDLSLPRRNGLEFIKNALAHYPDLKIVVFSMHDEMLYAERALEAGARGYLMKSEEPSELLHAVHKVLDGGIYLSEKVSQHLLSKQLRGGSDQDGQSSKAISNLSDRELEIFELIGRGLQNQRISELLAISVKTVDAHKLNIRKKLGLHSNYELLRMALTSQLLE